MSIQKMNTPRERDTEMSNTPIKRSDCQCGVCAMLATATPTLHTHATQRAAQQCIQPGCIPPAVATVYFENESPRDKDPAHNAPTVGERFGIPNPREVMAEVDRIVDGKLGGRGTLMRAVSNIVAEQHSEALQKLADS
jgi:hypothetical protein